MSGSGLRLEEVSHAYDGGDGGIDRIGFAVAPGEIVCLLGPSGCGKTTTLRLIAGLETPSAGRIEIAGVAVSGPGVAVPPEKRRVGLMFQDYALFPHLRVIENVAFGLRGLPRAARRERALALLGQVGMGDFAEAYPHVLSGGEQQRVALARALAPEPDLVLLDEAFSDLDPQLRVQVRDDTLHLLKTSGAATVLVTHDPEEAMAMADRVVVMNRGRIEQDGTPEEAYCRPASPFVAAFLGEVNRFAGRVSGGGVDTPLGPVAAPGIGEGRPVSVLVRPEAVRIGPADGEGAEAEVEAVRMVGRSTIVHLALDDGGERRHVHARAPGRLHAAEGERRRLALEGEQIFVFAEGRDAPRPA